MQPTSADIALRPVLALLVPDGVGLRNYLLSSLPARLHAAGFQLIVIHRLDNAAIDMVRRVHGDIFSTVALPDLPPDRWGDFLRRFCLFVRLQRNARLLQNESIADNWFYFSLLKGRKKILFSALNTVAGWIARSPRLADALESYQRRRLLATDYAAHCRQLLEQVNPQVLICTHQRSIEAAYLMEAANEAGICTASVVFSWDNLPKTRITYQAQHWLVWSQIMAKEFGQLYPQVPAKHVHVTGTPQFEGYYNSFIVWERQTFIDKLQLPAKKHYLLFSGNEPSFPADHLYLQDVLDALEQQQMSHEVMVLVRPSPNDHTGRLADVCQRYPHLATLVAPLWQRIGDRDWETNIPTPEDNEWLINLAAHCAAVINIGSTMCLDFAHFDKPAICPAYRHPACPHFEIEKGYQQQHLQEALQTGAWLMVHQRKELGSMLQQALQHPMANSASRQAWRYAVTNDIHPAAARITQVLQAIGHATA